MIYIRKTKTKTKIKIKIKDIRIPYQYQRINTVYMIKTRYTRFNIITYEQWVPERTETTRKRENEAGTLSPLKHILSPFAVYTILRLRLLSICSSTV